MCYVIVTGRSLLWTLLSLTALMAVLSGLITPRWLVGPPTIKDTSKCTDNFRLVEHLVISASSLRKRHGTLHTHRRDLQPLHEAVRQVALRKLQRGRPRDRPQRVPGMLEGFLVLLVLGLGGDVDYCDSRSAGLLRAEYRPQEHLQSGRCGAGRSW